MNRTILVAALALSVHTGALAQTISCPDGREVGELGRGAAMLVRALPGLHVRGCRLITTFTTEPRVHASPPADAVLEEGDADVSVDGPQHDRRGRQAAAKVGRRPGAVSRSGVTVPNAR
jgi:hypothetical protein